MAETILTRISKAWNAFVAKEELDIQPSSSSGSYGISHHRIDRAAQRYGGGEKSIIASVYTRMGIDVSVSRIQHVKVDDNERYLETIKSGLNECLTTSANIDQTGTAFLLDAAISLFDEGVIAIVAVDTTKDPLLGDEWDVNSLRVGIVKEWFPRDVKIDLYNDRTGKHEEITLPKTKVAIVENPFYNIMNAHNSILKRLLRKLTLLDVVDEQSSSGKLDIIIQLPYLLKGEKKKEQAEERRNDIANQLRGSEFGIAYTDATEKVIQLNRPSTNNLMEQITFLTSMLYSQLGITTSIMDGTADEATMINYYKRTIEPIVNAIVESMERTFLSKTARTRGQRIMVFNDPFKLVPMSALAEIADKFTRNEILSSNEVRGTIGFKPSQDPKADELRNKNISQNGSGMLPEGEPMEGGMNLDETV